MYQPALIKFTNLKEETGKGISLPLFKLQIIYSLQSLIHFFKHERNSHAQLLELIIPSSPVYHLSYRLTYSISFDAPPLSTIVSRFNKLSSHSHPLVAIVYAPYRGNSFIAAEISLSCPPLRKDANEREIHGYTDTRPRYLYNLFVYLSGVYATDTGHVAIMGERDVERIHLIKRTIG